MWSDLAAERARTVPYPPGEHRFSMRRTNRFIEHPMRVLVDGYERYGPIYTLRIFHHNVVFMLGPQANHHVLVTGAENLSWRGGELRALIPLLGDGLLTTDGAYHRAHRRMMLPAFHRERIATATRVMEDEVERAASAFVPGSVIDVYAWTRNLALRVAMRALFGLSPDSAGDPSGRLRGPVLPGGRSLADEFETALSFHARSVAGQVARGPGSPYARVLRARQRLDALLFAEIDRRRTGDGLGEDLLSLLVEARDEDGDPLPREQIRDEVMTLLFAGHDTTTSTVAFLFYELARNPEIAEDPGITMEMLIDETLRKYPPAYIGPRRSIEAFEFRGMPVPARAHVQYCSWASHHLPDVWPDPDRFDPYRFTPERKAALEKGAYVPFGGGSRTCIGMRFGQAEIAAITRTILERARLELVPGYELGIRHAPTISPRGGMPMTVRSAAPAALLSDRPSVTSPSMP